MKLAGKHGVVYMLMITSMLLLLVLQYFWLRSTFHDTNERLRKETGTIFRNTVLALQDSLLARSIVTFDTRPLRDSVVVFRQGLRREVDTIRLPVDSIRTRRGVVKHERVEEKRIQIFISSDTQDSLPPPVAPLLKLIQADGKRAEYMVRLRMDTLSTDSIKLAFAASLQNSGIDIPVQVFSFTQEEWREKEILPDAQFSEPVRVSPFNQYAFSMGEPRNYIFRKMTPQILFSVFVTLITAGAFAVAFRSLRSQERLMALKNDFISNMTHELKTPVATVSVALEAIQDFNVINNPTRANEYLQIAQSELHRLTLITDKILKTMVFENKGVSPMLESTDVRAVVDEVLQSMRLVFEKTKISAKLKLEGENLNARMAKEHLTNVIYNLVDNAIKYSKPGTGVTIHVQRVNEKISIAIADQGIGIPSEYKSKIFEKFFRVPTGDVHNTKGYGLGLSYVASVIKSYGGTIQVESEPGKGSRFVITITGS